MINVNMVEIKKNTEISCYQQDVRKSGVVGSKYWKILFYHKNTNEMTIIDTER